MKSPRRQGWVRLRVGPRSDRNIGARAITSTVGKPPRNPGRAGETLSKRRGARQGSSLWRPADVLDLPSGVGAGYVARKFNGVHAGLL